MNRQKFSAVQKNFLQRRYGVNLGRRYVLAAASFVMLSVLGCSQVDQGNKFMNKYHLPSSETEFTKDNL
ncbi:proteinase inhibitor I4 serpin [Sphaerospermopsis aphanizomenoides BCCUSP55]|uniref:proteinase inhibitor I4 serpin n=1 Tax=Sphaerospermopsis aphanizomenoides TaxID=459663 RepID=UPI00190409A0|nr:proteinase inhibitor I4 serpin [Sphaerospermopsis aphanizomenoides]MBK1987045.1 proteinase inhibitor I4 serpin [Sphaerospermopsis aphanizomenoides BCCUSP55]